MNGRKPSGNGWLFYNTEDAEATERIRNHDIDVFSDQKILISFYILRNFIMYECICPVERTILISPELL